MILLSSEPDSVDVLRLLAQTEELLLNYHAAAVYLETAMELEGRRTKSDLKKLSLYLQEDQQWKELGLSPRELKRLGDFLKAELAMDDMGRDFRWTESWLATHCPERKQRIIDALTQRGAFSDFSVLQNVVAA
jgi:hypothetical protein